MAEANNNPGDRVQQLLESVLQQQKHVQILKEDLKLKKRDISDQEEHVRALQHVASEQESQLDNLETVRILSFNSFSFSRLYADIQKYTHLCIIPVFVLSLTN